MVTVNKETCQHFGEAYVGVCNMPDNEDAKNRFADILYEISHFVLIDSEVPKFVRANEELFRELKQELVAKAWKEFSSFNIHKVDGDFIPVVTKYFTTVMSNHVKTVLSSQKFTYPANGCLAENPVEIPSLASGDAHDEMIEKMDQIKKMLEEAEKTKNPREYMEWLKQIVVNLTFQLSQTSQTKIFIERNFKSYLENFRGNGMTGRELIRLKVLFPSEALQIIDLGIESKDFPIGTPDDGREELMDRVIANAKKKREISVSSGRSLPPYAWEAWNYLMGIEGHKAMESDLVARFGSGLKTTSLIWDRIQRIAKDKGFKAYRDTIGNDKSIRIVVL